MISDKQQILREHGFSIKRHNGTVTISLPVNIDIDNFMLIYGSIEEECASGTDTVVVDCRKTAYINSVAINLFMKIRTGMLSRGGSMTLKNLSDRCRASLEQVGLHKILSIK